MSRRPGHWHWLPLLLLLIRCSGACVLLPNALCFPRGRHLHLQESNRFQRQSVGVLCPWNWSASFAIFDDEHALCSDPPSPTTDCQWQQRRCSVRAFVWSAGLRHTRKVWRSGKQKDGSDNDNKGSDGNDHDTAAAVKFLKPNLN